MSMPHLSAALKQSLWTRMALFAPLAFFFPKTAEWIAARQVELGITGLWGMPAWFVGGWLATAVIALLFLHHAVKLHRQIRGTRTELSKLRAEGVKLRNSGVPAFQDYREWEKWSDSVNDWRERVIAEIRNINEADAEWFSVLDVIPPPRLACSVSSPPQQWEKDRLDAYQFHDYRVKLLGEMIRDLWRR